MKGKYCFARKLTDTNHLMKKILEHTSQEL